MRRKTGSITKKQLRGKGGKSSSSVRLDFSHSPLYGRDKERKILREMYCLASLGKIQTVLVKGPSGTGKSTLVTSSLQKAIEATGGVLCCAKFHEDHPRAPYTAIVDIFTKLLQHVTIDPVRIKEEMGPDVQYLFPLIPKLRQVFPSSTVQSYMPQPNDAYALDRFLRLFTALLKAVVSARQPVVLFWDDIHWADKSSLRFIRYLLSDPSLRYILVVATYRHELEFQLQDEFFMMLPPTTPQEESATNNNRNYSTHHVSSPTSSSNGNNNQGEGGAAGRSSITYVTIDNLEFDDINDMIAAAVGANAEVSEPLTLVVYRTTGGNCFHTLQFLGMLQDEDFLYYFPDASCWEYDLEGIVSGGANVAVSVEELVVQRVRHLPPSMQTILKLASCIGFTFDTKLLLLLSIEEYPVLDMDEQKLTRYVQGLVSAGLLENGPESSPHELKFPHDRVRRCAYAMKMEGKERDALHLRIGFLMQKLYETDSHFAKEWVFFALVDHLNWGSPAIDDDSETSFLIKLNLEAAREAKQRSAFVLAAEYLELATKLLNGTGSWDEDYQQYLELTSFGAEMNLCAGNLVESQRLAQDAIGQAKHVRHKIRPFYVMMQLSSAREDPREGCVITLAFLRELGCQVPKRPNSMHVRSEVASTRRMLRNTSDAEVMALPLATDAVHVASIKLLTMGFIYLAMAGQPKRALAPICSCRAVQLSIKHGISSYSPAGFACYAITMCMMGNIREAEKYSDVSLKLLNRFRGNDDVRAMVSFLVFCKIHHWAHPLADCLEPFRCGYRAGIRSGTIEQGIVNAAMYGQAYYICGLPLLRLSSELKRYASEVLELRQGGSSVILLNIVRQLSLNILGYAQDPLVLTGAALQQDEAEARSNEEIDGLCRRVFLWGQLELATLLHSVVLLEKLLPEIVTMRSPRGKAHFGYVRESFLVGLGYIKLLRSNAKYKRQAKQHIARFEKWVKKDSVNCVHMLLLLRAEYSALQRNHMDGTQFTATTALYGQAISAAAKAGCTQDEAMAHEYAGDFCMRLNAHSTGSKYIVRAFELYQTWGAFIKMEQLRHTYGDVSLGDHDSKSGSSGSGLSRSIRRGRKKTATFEEPEQGSFPQIESMDALTELVPDEEEDDLHRRHSE